MSSRISCLRRSGCACGSPRSSSFSRTLQKWDIDCNFWQDIWIGHSSLPTRLRRETLENFWKFHQNRNILRRSISRFQAMLFRMALSEFFLRDGSVSHIATYSQRIFCQVFAEWASFTGRFEHALDAFPSDCTRLLDRELGVDSGESE